MRRGPRADDALSAAIAVGTPLLAVWGWVGPSADVEVAVWAAADRRGAVGPAAAPSVPPGARILNPGEGLWEHPGVATGEVARFAQGPPPLLRARGLAGAELARPDEARELAALVERSVHPADLPPGRRGLFERWKRTGDAEALRGLGADYLLLEASLLDRLPEVQAAVRDRPRDYRPVRRWTWYRSGGGIDLRRTEHLLFRIADAD